MFNLAMSRSFEVLGPDGFRFQTYNVNKRPINMALFEAMAHFFAMVNLDGLDKAALKRDLDELKTAFDNSGFFKGRVDSTTSVEYRFKSVESLAGRKEI